MANMKKLWQCGFSCRNKFGKQYTYSQKYYATLADAMKALAECYSAGRLDEERHHPEFKYVLVPQEESEA